MLGMSNDYRVLQEEETSWNTLGLGRKHVVLHWLTSVEHSSLLTCEVESLRFHRNTSVLHSASTECYTRIWIEILTWGVFFLNKTGLLLL